MPLHQLDVNALFRASRALSGEIELNTLIRNLMQVVIENAAAERGILFLMAAVILWMGIGSTFITRRTEAATQTVLQLMQRPRAYDAGARNDLDHPAMPLSGANAATSGGVANLVNSK